MLDPEGNILTWNDGAQRIKGYSANEIIGKHFSVFYTPESNAKRHPQKELEIATAKGRYEEEGWRVRKDGSLFWANVLITALFDKDKLVGFAKVTRDLTERKNAENARDKAFKEVAALNEELQQLAYVISHELQEPLASMTSYSNLLASRYQGRLGSDADDFLHRIQSAAKMTGRLVDDLWTYARVSKPGTLQIDLNFGTILNEAKDELKQTIQRTNARIDCADTKFPTVHGNKEQLVYVVKELLNNAMKHHKGPGNVRIEISVTQERNGSTFSFKDNGPGVDKFFSSQVFGIYQRVDAKPSESGTGMGLPICRRIIEDQHKGRIGFESVAGEGAKFFFWLPEVHQH
jgi:PAS domain S-box-containing protein